MRTLRPIILLLALLAIIPAARAQQTDLERKLAELGIDRDALIDLSHTDSVCLPTPNCAYVNITGVDRMPWSKTSQPSIDLHATLELFDGNGHYMKKRILLNAQGNSSLQFPKQNFAVDFCEDEWQADSTTNVVIGPWVAQDGFHFKAYYLDKFRGTGTIGYWLYDQMVATHDSFRDRLGGKEPSARYYPDGFPCVVYLNGAYYGLYAWQLKKHRRNMGMSKDTSAHIHLDGKLNTTTLWYDKIDWSALSIRNPKTLYSTQLKDAGDTSAPAYAKYDKDYPAELLDSTKAYYDPEKPAHVRSNEVKQSIVTLSRYCNEVAALSRRGLSTTQIREEFSRRFDVTSMIDYKVFDYFVNNYDGFDKNWQWFTLDGVRWGVAPYDLDGTFGAHYSGALLQPAEYLHIGSSQLFTTLATNNNGPMYWLQRYYMDDIKARYRELRSRGVFAVENIVSLFRKWESAVGEANYRSEWERWPQSPCILPLIVNPGWRMIDDWTNYTRRKDYDASTRYLPGDRCRYKFYDWMATDTVQGVVPVTQVGFVDNLERVEQWVTERLAIADRLADMSLDDLMQSHTLTVSNAEWATVCLPFAFEIPEGMECYAVEGVDEAGECIVAAEQDYTIPHRPYLVHAAQGRYLLTGLPADTTDVQLRYGLLTGCYTDTDVPSHAYVLQNHNGVVAFYEVMPDEAIRLSANRAYLSLPEASATRRYVVAWGELPTLAPTSTTSPQRITNIYNIYGVPLHDAQRGLNLITTADGRVRKVLR